jgi:hypothetical protein
MTTPKQLPKIIIKKCPYKKEKNKNWDKIAVQSIETTHYLGEIKKNVLNAEKKLSRKKPEAEKSKTSDWEKQFSILAELIFERAGKEKDYPEASNKIYKVANDLTEFLFTFMQSQVNPSLKNASLPLDETYLKNMGIRPEEYLERCSERKLPLQHLLESPPSLRFSNRS